MISRFEARMDANRMPTTESEQKRFLMEVAERKERAGQPVAAMLFRNAAFFADLSGDALCDYEREFGRR